MPITLDDKTREEILARLINWFSEELEQDIGRFDGEFLLNFFSEQMGPYYYNQALADVQKLMQKQQDAFNEALYNLEKPVEKRRS